MRGCAATRRRRFIQIIDPLLGSTKIVLPRSLEPIVMRWRRADIPIEIHRVARLIVASCAAQSSAPETLARGREGLYLEALRRLAPPARMAEPLQGTWASRRLTELHQRQASTLRTSQTAL